KDGDMRCIKRRHVSLSPEEVAELEDRDRVAGERDVFVRRKVDAELSLVLKLDRDAVEAVEPGVRVAPHASGPRDRRLHAVLGLADLLADPLVGQLERIEREKREG